MPACQQLAATCGGFRDTPASGSTVRNLSTARDRDPGRSPTGGEAPIRTEPLDVEAHRTFTAYHGISDGLRPAGPGAAGGFARQPAADREILNESDRFCFQCARHAGCRIGLVPRSMPSTPDRLRLRQVISPCNYVVVFFCSRRERAGHSALLAWCGGARSTSRLPRSTRHDLERFAALQVVATQGGTPDQSLWSPNRVSAWRKALSEPGPRSSRGAANSEDSTRGAGAARHRRSDARSRPSVTSRTRHNQERTVTRASPGTATASSAD